MVRLSLVIVVAALAVPSLAAAQPARQLVSRAAETLEDAELAARRARGDCRRELVPALEAVTARVYPLRRGRGLDQLYALKAEVARLAATAADAGCPRAVLEQLHLAQEQLEEVRAALWSERRGRRGDDAEDADPSGSPPGYGQVAPLRVTLGARFEDEPAVRVAVPELRLTGLEGHTFYFGARFRSERGPWSEWVTTQQWAVTQDPLIWKNPFNHYFRASSLAEVDYARGRFVAQVSVFDGQTGQLLGSRDATFEARLPELPDGPPVEARPPPEPPPTARDCGTGPDVGCDASRDGQWPMDGAAFNALLQALRSARNEAFRAQLARSALQRSASTALQLGMVLDLFPDEQLRLSVAQAGVAHLVNPQHALGYAARWRAPPLQAEFTRLVYAALAPRGAVFPSPGPGGRGRDCGTGVDPGCELSRDGQVPLDAVAYQGVLTALRGSSGELGRKDLCEAVLRRQTITALQLRGLLELFSSELLRLDVARLAAPRVVDARRALGLAATFRNPSLAAEFARLMEGQP
jgi:hypothetical protein